jgi:hypothetical protein
MWTSAMFQNTWSFCGSITAALSSSFVAST